MITLYRLPPDQIKYGIPITITSEQIDHSLGGWVREEVSASTENHKKNIIGKAFIHQQNFFNCSQ